MLLAKRDQTLVILGYTPRFTAGFMDKYMLNIVEMMKVEMLRK
jgi:hypothetical protein